MRDRSAARAARLAQLYPREWRERFPDFEEVLAAELVDHHRGLYGDVVATAVAERLRAIGVIPRRPADAARSGLALIYAALVPFAGLALGMWSQLHTGLVSLGAATPPVLRVSNLWLFVATLVVLAALPLALALFVANGRHLRKDPRTRVGRFGPVAGPATALVAALAALTVAGWSADRSGWDSPAAAALPPRGPGYLATMWVRGIVAPITPAWIHPTLFARMPTGQLVAALLGPVAGLVAAAALFRLVARLVLRTPSRADVALAATAFGTMLISVVACTRWLLDHPTREGATTVLARSDQLAPGHTGWAVVSILVVLTIIALVGLRRVLRAVPQDPPSAAHLDEPWAVTDPAVPGDPIRLRFSIP